MHWMNPPGGRPWALLGVCGASLVLNLVLTTVIVMDNDPSAAAPDPTAALDIAPETVVPTAEPGTVTPPQEVAPSVADSQMVAPTAAETEAARSGNVEVVRATVAHSLARTFQRNAPEAQADVLNAVYSRLFFWDLDLRKDLQKGEVLEVAEKHASQECDVEVP